MRTTARKLLLGLNIGCTFFFVCVKEKKLIPKYKRAFFENVYFAPYFKNGDEIVEYIV